MFPYWVNNRLIRLFQSLIVFVILSTSTCGKTLNVLCVWIWCATHSRLSFRPQKFKKDKFLHLNPLTFHIHSIVYSPLTKHYCRTYYFCCIIYLTRTFLNVNFLNKSYPQIPPPPTSSSGAQPQQTTANKKLQQTQAKVDEVVGIMRVNVEKVLERDQKLSELDNRADALQQGASQFEQQATKLKRKQWWNNMKMMIIMGVIAVVILIIIIGEWFFWIILFCLCAIFLHFHPLFFHFNS